MKGADMRAKKIKGRRQRFLLLFVVLLFLAGALLPLVTTAAESMTTPIAFIKAQELAHKDAKGEVYLGKVLTINYATNSARVIERYDRLLMELVDVLKTPERRSYRLVIKGYTDSTGPRWLNNKLSLKRANELKRLLVEKYYLDPGRITVEGHGPENPIASNKTPSGRAMNRRSELHIYGDVSEAIKMLLPPPAPKVAEKKPPTPPLFKPKKPAVVPKPAKPAPKVMAKPEVKPSRGTPPVTGPLPEALRGLVIKDYFVPSTEKRAGVIRAMLGHVVVVHRATNEAYFGRTGDTIYENDAIYTLDDSRCRIYFFDDDLVSMAANTQFALDQYEDKREEKRKLSFFSMLKGKAMFYALRLFRYKQMAFRVKTPTAVVGVRGTKFGVHVRWLKEKTASVGNPVVASSDPVQAFLIAAKDGGGGSWCTDTFCEDGVIEVDGKEVPAGYTYHCETGEVTPSDPEYISQFEEETGVGKEKKRGKGKEEVKEGSQIPPELGPDEFADATDAQSDSTNDQNVPGTTTDQYMGYFSALLTNTSGEINLQDVYSSTTAQDFESNAITADSLITSGGLLRLNPGFVNNTTSYLTRIVTQGASGVIDSGDLGTQYPLNVTTVGSNSYMEWGYWTMETAWTYNGEDYIVNSPAWYVYGLVTSDTVIQGLTGTVNYSGQAFGTYHPAWASGVSMNGNFSCQVDFGSGSISNFNLNVSGGSYSASITNAGGTLSGGQFSLSGGTWSLTTGTADQQSASGTFYGPNAQYIGGSWEMRDSYMGDAAAGIFQGSRQ